jgi:Ca2+-binding RTX toxin-like protein
MRRFAIAVSCTLLIGIVPSHAAHAAQQTVLVRPHDTIAGTFALEAGLDATGPNPNAPVQIRMTGDRIESNLPIQVSNVGTLGGIESTGCHDATPMLLAHAVAGCLAPAGGFVTGGGGDDFLLVQEPGVLAIGFGGNDTIRAYATNNGSATVEAADPCEETVPCGQAPVPLGNTNVVADGGLVHVSGGNGNDTIDVRNAGPSTVYGNGGNDVILGGGSADHLYGGPGDDVLMGFEGADSLYGDTGNDTLTGGGENDTLVGGFGADNMYGGGGFDTVDYTERSSAGVIVTFDGLANDGNGTDDAGVVQGVTQHDNVAPDVEHVIGTGASDVLFGNPSQFSVLEGGAGRDLLSSTRGVAWMIGGSDLDPDSYIAADGPGLPGDTISCGPGDRIVNRDAADAVYGC